MKGSTCNLIARTALPHKAYGRHRANAKGDKIDVVFCAVSNGIIDASYIKPGKTIVRILKNCWHFICAPNAHHLEKRKFHY
ncbi:hypothetical protein F3J38_03480 [Pantoea sp. Acro-805]|jgi:hypothetical protein|uniref:Uncharacterized protein n=1 Tax=Candidatus Pantoea formicae TaxID=2608355 RepID=A0ABX0QUG4_9GAMM|nr:hypothetical protein [Pantoea formicae]NIE99139.1 hypothetical protein [Pantoea formicae]